MKQKFVDAHMAAAEVYSKLSSAKRLQVGCVVVKDNTIIGIGYNGMPSGWTNDCENLIQLSDDTDYEGGDLQLKMSSQKPYCASRLKGDGLVFPSWILHGVTPVTKGVRKSLVVWAEGPEWR